MTTQKDWWQRYYDRNTKECRDLIRHFRLSASLGEVLRTTPDDFAAWTDSQIEEVRRTLEGLKEAATRGGYSIAEEEPSDGLRTQD